MDTKELGFWRSLGSLRLGQVVAAWDFAVSLIVAVAAVVLAGHHVPEVDAHYALAGDLLVVSSGALAVTLAGFAIVAALLGDKYTRMLTASGTSSLQMLRHFLIVAGLLTASILVTLSFRMAGRPLHAWEPVAEQVTLGVMVFLFLWSFFGLLELMKLVLGVAVTNTELRALEGGAISARDAQKRAGGEPGQRRDHN